MKEYQLENSKGVAVSFIPLGGKLTSILIPSGKHKADILMGYDTVEDYLNGDVFFGAIVGRYANRIAHGRVVLEGKEVGLEKNQGEHHIHGGNHGFQNREWQVEPITRDGYTTAYRLLLLSPDGEEHYPGNLQVEVVYALNERNELLIDLKARTDMTTVINLTSHPYFNLNGAGKETVLNHQLQVQAEAYTPLAEDAIPTGEIRRVSGTGMDLREAVFLRDVIKSEYPAIQKMGGLDFNWVLRRKDVNLVPAAVLSEPNSGRAVEIFTTQPGLQIYTANHLDGNQMGKGGYPLKAFSGIALEPQNFPDAPNKPNFPNAVLHPGDLYHHQIVYRFRF